MRRNIPSMSGVFVPRRQLYGCDIVSCGIPSIFTDDLVRGALATVGGSPTGEQRSLNPNGWHLQFHPSGGASGYQSLKYSEDGAGDNLSILWVGIPDNISTANGELIHHGEDGSGNGWNAALHYFNSTALRASCVDGSPAGFDVDLTITGLSTGIYQRCMLVKHGTSLEVYDWRTRTSATGSGGNGTLRTSTVGPALASDVSGFGAGHNRCSLWAIFRGGLAPNSVWSILDNPWQIFRKTTNRLGVIPVSAPASNTLMGQVCT